DSINSLLPVAGIGGDIASVRLAHLQGVPGAQAAASMVVDTTIGVATQLIFVISGVGLLLMRSTERSALLLAWIVLIGTGVFIVLIAAFVLFQHRGLFAGFANLARRLVAEKWLSTFAASASAIDDAVAAAYRSGWSILRATILRLIGWAAGAGEIWLVMQSLGHPLGMLDAFTLESLSSGVRGNVHGARRIGCSRGRLYPVRRAVRIASADSAGHFLIKKSSRIGLGCSGAVCLALDRGALPSTP